jgi:hypothetical protein
VNLLSLGFPVLSFVSREPMAEQARLAWWGEAPEQPNRIQKGVSHVRGCREQRRLTAEPLGGTARVFSRQTLHNGLKSYSRKRGTLWINGSDFATVVRVSVTSTNAMSDKSARVLAPIRSMHTHSLEASRRRLGRSGASPHHAKRQTPNAKRQTPNAKRQTPNEEAWCQKD